DANSEGGTHNPLIVFWPGKIRDRGGIRTQYSYVTDLLPTTLELTGVKFPAAIRNIPQDSLHGVSLAESIDRPEATSRHTQQYYYIWGSRAIYKDGWKAAAAHHPDAIDIAAFGHGPIPKSDFDQDVWELYNLNEDFNERIDLAGKNPEKLAELKAVFDADA